ncbi:enhancer of split m7 protein-like [Polypterus senegalus]|uniref:enhancer of split m7 protein-like n=1 Tax=Polypterus senegalus TaxID=55291 RepID=UPI0019631F2C|nr:enhancer of split m7 protein-like [Polypterus senegalus]
MELREHRRVCFTPRQLLYQKIVKPRLEQRRRARINLYLEELKQLIEEQPGERPHTRLDKADILERTVRYIQKHRMDASPCLVHDSDFKAGFQNCLLLAHQFLCEQAHVQSKASVKSIDAERSRPKAVQPGLPLTRNSWSSLSGNSTIPVCNVTIQQQAPPQNIVCLGNISRAVPSTSEACWRPWKCGT